MSEEGILYAEADGIARIVLSRPQTKNALGPTDWHALADAVDRARAARVLVIAGSSGAFCAGGDLKTIEERLALSFDARHAQLLKDAQVIRKIVELDCPTVALIDGPAMGAGLSLALACDVRLASARSRFSAAFSKVGLAGDFGISWLLPRIVGRGRALDLLYTGEALSAEDAQGLGIIERVFSDEVYAAETDRYVRAIAAGAASLSIIRRVVDEVDRMSLADALDREAAGQAQASRTDDAREGARAYLEKRPPTFQRR